MTKIITVLSAKSNSVLVTLDITFAYLNSPLFEKIFVQYSIEFSVPEFFNLVCQLNRALYKLRQVVRA